MRDIKFRAWDKPKKRMLWTNVHDRCWYATPYNDDNGCHCIGDKHQADAHWFTLMQFTGLHDKNGIDIYEGDIVIIPILQGLKQIPHIVKWLDGNFMFNADKDTSGYIFSGHGAKKCEVIGNIYENPELLEAQ